MRKVSATVKSTPTSWLSVLSHIMSIHLRRKQVEIKEWIVYIDLPTHKDTKAPEMLKSKKPVLI